MAWVKLDDSFPDHRKLAELGDYEPLGGWLFVCGIAYCNRQLTDGLIPKSYVCRLVHFEHLTVNGIAVTVLRVTEELLRVGLWEDAETHYRIHDYLDYQPSREEIESGRTATARRVKAFRDRHKRNAVGNAGSNADGNAVGNSVSNAGVTPHVPGTGTGTEVLPSVPVPRSENEEQGESRTLTLRHSKVEAPLFDRFWVAYPSKVGKGDARKAWDQISPKPTEALLERMLRTLAWQRESPKWLDDRGQYIPDPGKWIRQQRWLDEPQQGPQVSGKTVRSAQALHDFVKGHGDDER